MAWSMRLGAVENSKDDAEDEIKRGGWLSRSRVGIETWPSRRGRTFPSHISLKKEQNLRICRSAKGGYHLRESSKKEWWNVSARTP